MGRVKQYGIHGRDHHPQGGDPTCAYYEIKIYANDEVVAAGTELFTFPVPHQLDGWLVTSLQSGVHVPDGGSNTEVYVSDTTQATELRFSLIASGDQDSGIPGTVGGTNAPVAGGDELAVNVSVGSAALGLAVIIELSPRRLSP